MLVYSLQLKDYETDSLTVPSICFTLDKTMNSRGSTGQWLCIAIDVLISNSVNQKQLMECLRNNFQIQIDYKNLNDALTFFLFH